MREKLKVLKHQAISSKRKHVRRLSRASRHPFAVPILVFVVLAVASISVWLYFANQSAGHSKKDETWNVIVSYDHLQAIVPSREPTVGSLIEKMHIVINPGDVIEPSRNTRINQDDFRVNIYRAAPVKIVDGDKTTMVNSAATTPRSIATQAGIETYPEDQLVARPVDYFLKQKTMSEVVTIKRSIPVQLILYGTPVITRSHSTTVGEMLKEKNLKLAPGDTVKPGLNTVLTANLQVFILRKGTTIVTETEQTPMPVQTIIDPKLSSGTSAIRQQGSPGQQLVTYQIDEKTGAKIKLQTVLIKSPVTQIVARGSAPVAGTLGVWLEKLRMCETHGNYQTNTGNGYYGAYQFLPGTWNRVAQRAGRSDLVGVLPSTANPADQDAMIIANTNMSGGGLASQNPGCYYKTGISAFPPPN